MRYKYILGIDPSGNFYEGKGTTGWCLFSCERDEVVSIGAISAKVYQSQEAYWGAHLNLIYNLQKTYKDKLGIAIEDYLLYANTAHSQINSRMETPQLIGVVKYYCYSARQEYTIHRAVDVMKRWADSILEYKGYINKMKHGYTTHCVRRQLCDHELDAIRHAVHCAAFEND